MFEENEESVLENNTENVEEPTTEETDDSESTLEEKMPEKLYTSEELNEILDKRIRRREAKIRKEYDSKYGNLESVLKKGTGVDDLNQLADQFKDFYAKKGIDIPNYESSQNDDDLDVLAEKDAKDIIEDGFDEVVREVDRLANKERSKRENLTFMKLAEYRKQEQSRKELAAMGVDNKALEAKDFVEFAKLLDPKMSLKDKYTTYQKYKPKKEIEPMGSMKNTDSTDPGVKDFYTREEALKFTRKDFDANPKLLEAVEKSMTKW